jgi:hypothetical protein
VPGSAMNQPSLDTGGGITTGSGTSSGMTGTQQDQRGSSGAGSGAASRNSNLGAKGGSRATDIEDNLDGPGPAGLDKGTSGYANAGRGAGLLNTGESVTAPPPPSLTGESDNNGLPATRSGAKIGGKAQPSSDRPDAGASSSSTAPVKVTPPPPSPAQSGAASTR